MNTFKLLLAEIGYRKLNFALSLFAVTIAVAAQAMSEHAGVVVEHPMAPGMAERIDELRASVPQQQLEALVSSGSSLSPTEVLAMCSRSPSL